MRHPGKALTFPEPANVIGHTRHKFQYVAYTRHAGLLAVYVVARDHPAIRQKSG
jgi:hypothetical protein